MNTIREAYEVYDTNSTELAAALLALGFDLVDADPIRRIFTERHPANRTVTHGLARGGQVQYRLQTDSAEFSGLKAGKAAQAYASPQDVDPAVFDAKLTELRNKLAGTEAGIMFETILDEYPLEVARYIRVAFAERNLLIDEIRRRTDMVELVRVKKPDGNFILHGIDCPPDKVAALLNA